VARLFGQVSFQHPPPPSLEVVVLAIFEPAKFRGGRLGPPIPPCLLNRLPCSHLPVFLIFFLTIRCLMTVSPPLLFTCSGNAFYVLRPFLFFRYLDPFQTYPGFPTLISVPLKARGAEWVFRFARVGSSWFAAFFDRCSIYFSSE